MPGQRSPGRSVPWRSELQIPSLRDQLRAEAFVGLRPGLTESMTFIELARGGENALGPQRDLAIAGHARERQALAHERVADAETALTRIDQQQAKLRDRA